MVVKDSEDVVVLGEALGSAEVNNGRDPQTGLTAEEIVAALKDALHLGGIIAQSASQLLMLHALQSNEEE